MSRVKDRLRIGVGAGFADDRVEPAGQLVERADLDYLVFECLAERTTARESLSLAKDPEAGYTPRLAERMERVLGPCLERGTRIVTNMGAANPPAGARLARRLARDMGLGDLSVAVVEGDEVTECLRARPDLPLLESGAPLESILPRLVSGHAYLGADAVSAALDTGAFVVMTGRVADPSLFLGPALHHFRWAVDDWSRIAAGSLAGHLLECCCQLTGGCFADPPVLEVPDLANLGHPFADIGAEGQLELGKCPDSGGRLDIATCTQQLLYEIHDPAAYLTPDCQLDVTGVDFVQTAPNQVRVVGARARPPTESYKVTVGYHDGYIGEGQVTYAGPNAVARARLAGEVILRRLADRGFVYEETRVDLIGLSSMHGEGEGRPEPYEVRLRVAARAPDRAAAAAVGFETRAMHVNGPAGGGGGSDPVGREVLAAASVLLPRTLAPWRVMLVEGPS
ncbi:MAG: DUF1446 domain-containing protein [Rhodospirillum sp.]|nr:DUF1446 domain-containing protein [Rhodospirillum sp.]